LYIHPVIFFIGGDNMPEIKLSVEEEFRSEDSERRKAMFLLRIRGIIDGKRAEVIEDPEKCEEPAESRECGG